MTEACTHIALSWTDIQDDAARLAAALAPRGPFVGIVAVARGGLVPAALVARSLGVRKVETIAVAAYEGETLGAPVLLKPPAAAGDGAGWAVIDDLVDTGTTARLVRAILPRAVYAALYAKPAGRALADCHVRDFPQSSWIDFPWEMAAAPGR